MPPTSETTRRPLADVLDDADWFLQINEAHPEANESEAVRRSGHAVTLKLIAELVDHLRNEE